MRILVVFIMADCSGTCAKSKAETSKESGYDARLDFFSDGFDPLLALKTSGVVPPQANAREHDNLQAYENAWSEETISRARSREEKTVKEVVNTAVVNERRWLQHQLPIKREIIPKYRNVLKSMDSVEGPMVLLKKCKDEKLKLKIWTRHSHGVRGYCTAYIVAFDKHWNMALEDVTEVWTRAKRRKIPALDTAACSAAAKGAKLKLPEVKVTACEDKKLERCERHVNQLLVRGEQIALVALVNSSQ